MSFNGDARKYYAFITAFENNIGRRIADSATKLTYLVQYCTGKAKEVVADCVVLPDADAAYDRALLLLKEQFGKPYDIARAYIDNLNSGIPLKNDVQSLVDLSNDMTRCELTLTQLGYMSDVNSTNTLKGIVQRLPYHMRTKWAEYIHKEIKAGREPSFAHLTQFIKERAEVASTTFGKDLVASEKKSNKPRDAKNKASTPKVTTLATDASSAATPKKNAPQKQVKSQCEWNNV